MIEIFDGYSNIFSDDITTKTLGELSTELTLSGITMTISDSDYSTLPAASIIEGDYYIDDDNVVSVCGSPTRINKSSKASSRTLNTGVNAYEGRLSYQGGYIQIPADIIDATTRLAILGYNNRTQLSSGVLKSERIGDYSYTTQTFAEQGGNSEFNSIKKVLDCYKNLSI
jgi:hypothetical protein